MNHLYEAIIGLGRSLDDIRDGRWRTRAIGASGDHMCAVGLISNRIVGRPCYLTRLLRNERTELQRSQNRTLWIMMDALRNTVTPAMRDHAIAMHKRYFCNSDHSAAFRHKNRVFEAMAGSDDSSTMEVLITSVNDSLTRDEAAAWFSDAVDLLVDELLPPLPRYQYCSACEQGLGWDGVTRHVTSCPERVPALV